MTTKFQDRLKELMGTYTFREFSEKIGVPGPTISGWLNNNSAPSVKVLIQICTKCDVSADWLLGLDERLEQQNQTQQDVFPNKNFIVSADDTLIGEGHTTGEVWIVSPDLKNDVEEGEAVEVVRSNVNRGIPYVYIVPADNDIVEGREIALLQNTFSSRTDLLTVIKLPPNEFRLITRKHILIMNPYRDKRSKTEVYMELPVDGDWWVRVAASQAGAFIGQIRPIVETIRPRQHLTPRQHLLQSIQNAKHSVSGVHYAKLPDEVHNWKALNTDIQDFYAANQRLAKAGKSVERVFILRRSTFFDPSGNFDISSLNIIEEQAQDLTAVFVTWEEKAKMEGLLIDMVLIDGNQLYLDERPGFSLVSWIPILHSQVDTITNYTQKFQRLKELGVHLSSELRGGKWIK